MNWPQTKAWLAGPVSRGNVILAILAMTGVIGLLIFALTDQRELRSQANSVSLSILCAAVADNQSAIRSTLEDSRAFQMKKHDGELPPPIANYYDKQLARFEPLVCEDLPILELGPIGGPNE